MELAEEPKRMGDKGADTAVNVTKQNGGVTLETTMESRGIKMPEWDFNDPNTIRAWKNASAAYARQASGEVRAVLGPNWHAMGFLQWERPR